MKEIERDEAIRHEDIRRAMNYSYRKNRLSARRMHAFVIRSLICSSVLLLAVLAVWWYVSCL